MKHTLWAIYDHESRAVGLAWAKTQGGAYKKYEINTGISRQTVYAEPIQLEEGFYRFPSLQ